MFLVDGGAPVQVCCQHGSKGAAVGKGGKDWYTLVPAAVIGDLRRQLERERGQVLLPDAMDRKGPAATTAWAWQWLFPSAPVSRYPRSGFVGGHHAHEGAVMRAVHAASLRLG